MNFLVKQAILRPNRLVQESVREASKKAGGSTKNFQNNPKPKHRGWKRQDGCWVESGTILVLQRTLRFHPGLNVGLGKNGTLFAMLPGRVAVTCEKTEPNWEHTWVQRCHSNRRHAEFYKKYFNVIPEPQHNEFKLIEEV